MTSDKNSFFIGIIGSGPIGLECGLHALKYGYQFVIFESGDDIANNVHLWSHVRLFTPLSMNMSLLGKTLLQKEDDEMNTFLTGGEYIEHYLRPVSRLLQSNIRLRHRVVSVGRHSTNKFIILVENGQNDCEEFLIVDCVIDASGTYNCPNYVGPANLPAINERALRTILPSPISYRIPNFDYEQFAGKRIVLIGKGHSAATSAVFLGKHMIIIFQLLYQIFSFFHS
jgi:cation diffusion facilitator CzcD-associated flavoprotein CzcO